MTFPARDPLAELVDRIRELVLPFRHVEAHAVWDNNRNAKRRIHISEHSSLLEQLREYVEPSGNATNGNGVHVDASRPAANLDAVDRLNAITKAAREWREQFDAIPMANLEADLCVMLGYAAAANPDVQAELAAAAGRWCTWIRVVAGWQTPPWRPNVHCPRCDTLPGDQTGLRVRLDTRHAMCLTCAATWGQPPAEVAIEVLARHINTTLAAEAAIRTAMAERGPRSYGGRA